MQPGQLTRVRIQTSVPVAPVTALTSVPQYSTARTRSPPLEVHLTRVFQTIIQEVPTASQSFFVSSVSDINPRHADKNVVAEEIIFYATTTQTTDENW